MKGIVWGNTFEDAKCKLCEIEEDYKPFSDIELRRETKHTYELYFTNGDSWMACSAIESNRGRACNISYIDHNIDADFINTIIKHCTRCKPFNALHYF